MDQIGQLFTSGVWVVHPGKEKEFIRAWEAFARWTSAHQSGAGYAHLLQDLDRPNWFLSYGPWGSADAVQQWRDTPEFKDFVDRARKLCEDFQPHRLKLVTKDV